MRIQDDVHIPIHGAEFPPTHRGSRLCSRYRLRSCRLKRYIGYEMPTCFSISETFVESDDFTSNPISMVYPAIAMPVRRRTPRDPVGHGKLLKSSVRRTPANSAKRPHLQVNWKLTDDASYAVDVTEFNINDSNESRANFSRCNGRPRLRPVTRVKGVRSEPPKAAHPFLADAWADFVGLYKTKLAIRNAYSLALAVATGEDDPDHFCPQGGSIGS